jgi:hypothetical protein
VQEKVGNPPSRTELFFSVKCIASREWQLDSPDRARPDTIELPIQLDEACGWGCRRNACYGKPCGDRLAAQVPGSHSLSTTMTRWPGNSSLATFRASCLSAAKTGVTAIPSGRSAITSNSRHGSRTLRPPTRCGFTKIPRAGARTRCTSSIQVAH